MPLTEQIVKSLKADGETKSYSDGHGLVLEVNKNGSKYWKLKHYKHKKSTTKSLGKWPELSVKDARIEAARFKLDSTRKKKETRNFKELALDWLERTRSSVTPKETARRIFLLDKYLLPPLGNYKPTEIDAKMILFNALKPIEDKGYFDTARKAKQLTGAVFRYATTLGEASGDPTSVLNGALKTAKVKHRPAITNPAELGHLLDDIGNYHGSISVEFGLRILPYVFVRPGELRHAEWKEIDFKAGLWRIPAEKMKMKAPHLVPLSRQVTGLLEELKKYTGEGKYLFPGRDKSKPISDMALAAALRYLGYSGDRVCPHGFRGTASTMLNELGYNSDWIERQLAHSERSGVRAAYNHADYLAERTRMMQEWADYLDRLLTDYLQSRG